MSGDYQSGTTIKREAGRSRRPLASAKTISAPSAPRPEIRLISISPIRMDGGAQHRIAPDPSIVNEYAEAMRTGVEFPPISVRFDGTDYWPSDGFQRLAAAKLAEFSDIRAEILHGTREDAQWDSYAANATHGRRRTPAETEDIIKKAFQHHNSQTLSNVQMAKHLHIPLTTLQRYRERLILSTGQDSATRTVTRGNVTYEMDVHGIGKKRSEGRTKPRREIQAEIAQMRDRASTRAKDLLNVVEKWARGQLLPARCLELIEDILQRQRHEDATSGAAVHVVN